MHEVRRRPGGALWRALLMIASALTAVAVLSSCASHNDTAGSGSPAKDAAAAGTRTITHDLGTTKISGKPKRVVALEYSFVEALEDIGVTPVGIADDKDPKRIDELIGKKISYTSVGTRLEPSLELVSSLSPDLIIADTSRHGKIYKQLSSIAPTIVLNSWDGSYQDIKDSEVTIADALGDKAAGEQALAKHEARMKALAAQVPAGTDGKFMLAVSNKSDMSLHTSSAFTGSVIAALGLTPAITSKEPIESGAGLERVVAVNPDVLLIALDGVASVYDKWKTTGAWNGMSAATKHQVYEVDRNQFSRFRGLHTAEVIGEAIVKDLQSAR